MTFTLDEVRNTVVVLLEAYAKSRAILMEEIAKSKANDIADKQEIELWKQKAIEAENGVRALQDKLYSDSLDIKALIDDELAKLQSEQENNENDNEEDLDED